MSVWLTNRKEPLWFDVAPDTEKSASDDESEGTNLQNFFEWLELELGFEEPTGVVYLTDVDGEEFLCRVSQVAMAKAPLSYVEPELAEWLEENETEPTEATPNVSHNDLVN